jgi:hypothetical protein
MTSPVALLTTLTAPIRRPSRRAHKMVKLAGWTYNYIASRYGNPSNAWAFWNCIGQCGATYKTATWY